MAPDSLCLPLLLLSVGRADPRSGGGPVAHARRLWELIAILISLHRAPAREQRATGLPKGVAVLPRALGGPAAPGGLRGGGRHYRQCPPRRRGPPLTPGSHPPPGHRRHQLTG